MQHLTHVKRLHIVKFAWTENTKQSNSPSEIFRDNKTMKTENKVAEKNITSC